MKVINFEYVKKLEIHDQLIMYLLKGNFTDDEKIYINQLVDNTNMNWELVVGKLMFNRVNGIAFLNMKEFLNIPREVRMCLELMYYAQKEKEEEHIAEIKEISELFETNNINHAFLKGSILNSVVYPFGTRISNDTDILVSAKDIKLVEKLLPQLGYCQGRYNRVTDSIDESTMKQKMFLRLNTHEIAPFVRINEKGITHVSALDVNFKLSAKDDLETTELLLESVCVSEKNGISIKRLEWDYFMIQLASHLYREARLATKIMSGADMHYYKFYDFYMMLTSENVELNWNHIIEIAKETKQERAIYYAMYCIDQLFPGIFDISILDELHLSDYSFVDEYIGRQNDNDIYHWKKSFRERFFDYTRRNEVDNTIKNVSQEVIGSLFNA